MSACESTVRPTKHVIRTGRWAGLIAIFGLVSGCGQRDVSGEYVAKYTNGLYRLHLVETPDKTLTGELDAAILQPTGTIQYQNMTVTGAADGREISLALKPVSFLSATIPLSGVLGWNSLTLTGARPGITVFARSDANEYQVALSALNVQARTIQVANAVTALHNVVLLRRQRFVAAANTLIDRMQRFESAAEGDIAELEVSGPHMDTVTGKMNTYLARERQLIDDPNASVDRGQISVALSQAMIQTDQVHYQVQYLESQFRVSAVPLMQSATETAQNCDWAKHPGATPNTETSACLDVIKAFPAFERSFARLRDSLIAFNNAYSATHERQQKLVDVSRSIE